jgi:transposase
MGWKASLTASKCQGVAAGAPQKGRPSMKKVIRIGMDLEFFSAACAGKRRRPAEDAQTEPPGDAQVLFRDRPCLVGIKACASSHYWARELLAMGHEVRLIPPIYVRPYVKRGKNDAAGAEAICEALSRQGHAFSCRSKARKAKPH